VYLLFIETVACCMNCDSQRRVLFPRFL